MDAWGNIDQTIVAISQKGRAINASRIQLITIINKRKKQCKELKEETTLILQKKKNLKLKLNELKKMKKTGSRMKIKCYSTSNQMCLDQSFIKSAIVMRKMAGLKRKNKELKTLRKFEEQKKQFLEYYKNITSVAKINKIGSIALALRKDNEVKSLIIKCGYNKISEINKEKKSAIVDFAKVALQDMRAVEKAKKNDEMKKRIAELEGKIAALKVQAEPAKKISQIHFFSDIEFKEFEDIQSIAAESLASPEAQGSGYAYDEPPPSCLSLNLSHDHPLLMNEGISGQTTLPVMQEYSPQMVMHLSSPVEKATPTQPESLEVMSTNNVQSMSMDADTIINEPPILENQQEYTYSVSDYDAHMYAKSPEQSDSGDSSTSGTGIVRPIPVPESPFPNFFSRKEQSEPRNAGGMFFNFGDSSKKPTSSIFNLF